MSQLFSKNWYLLKNRIKDLGFVSKLAVPIFCIIFIVIGLQNYNVGYIDKLNNFNTNKNTILQSALDASLLKEKIDHLRFDLSSHQIKSIQGLLSNLSKNVTGLHRITLNRLDIFLEKISKENSKTLWDEHKFVLDDLDKLKEEKIIQAKEFQNLAITVTEKLYWPNYLFLFFLPISLLIFLVVMIKRIINPLEEMSNFVTLVTKGKDYNYRSEYEHEGQLGRLEKSVNDLLYQMSTKDSNMKALLDGLYESVFFFDRTNQISQERSKSVARIFKGSETITDMITFLQKYFGLDEIQSKEMLELVWDAKRVLDFQSTMEIFPRRLSENEGTQSELHVILNYVDQYDSQGRLQKVIVLAQDVTKEVQNERENRKQMFRSKRVQMISGDIYSYRDFIQEIQKIIINIDEILTYPSESKLIYLKRYVHTFKGSSSIFEFNEVSELLHKMENVINDLGIKHGLRPMREIFQECLDVFNFEKNYVENILRIDKLDEMVSFPKDKFYDLKKAILKFNSKGLNDKLIGLSLSPLNVFLRKYKKFLKRLTDREDNKQIELIANSNSCEVYPEEMNELDLVFTHILRNCYDHGIETVVEREMEGKSHSGKISVKTYRDQDKKTFVLEISDDGRGIDYEKLAQKAVDRGFWTPQKKENASMEEKMALMFETGISSKDEITEISGRGVGMDAVKDFVENQLCGDIKIASFKGKGSTFWISVPDHVTQKVLQLNEAM